ncbi:hypothetical protein [Microvirga guangxiensis]|uniref:hypothetical protein n=1 Tax=Microvirga guangxiensis TaxID=549386 RepID=UPI000AAF3166|nr:hypothetical protein [Microvirga guangxiensis]
MTPVRSLISGLVRCVLAAVLVIGLLGPSAMAAGEHRTVAATAISHGSPAHDCCDPEPAAPDGSCALACAQARCGSTAVPAIASLPAPHDRRAIRWEIVSVLLDDISPETTTPPPRA